MDGYERRAASHSENIETYNVGHEPFIILPNTKAIGALLWIPGLENFFVFNRAGVSIPRGGANGGKFGPAQDENA